MIFEEEKRKADTKGIQIQQEFAFLFNSVLSRTFILGQSILDWGWWIFLGGLNKLDLNGIQMHKQLKYV